MTHQDWNSLIGAYTAIAVTSIVVMGLVLMHERPARMRDLHWEGRALLVLVVSLLWPIVFSVLLLRVVGRGVGQLWRWKRVTLPRAQVRR